MMAKSKRDYLFKRVSSDNFWIKLRSPAGRVERSLGTSDRREAEILAGPMITEHKRALLAARPICKRFANSNPASTRVLTAVKSSPTNTS